MKKVLWLASWYPNRLDRFDGDFIQRHARAVVLFCKVHVIYVKKDDELTAGKVLAETLQSGNLSEQVIYYNSVKTGIKFIDRILSHRKYIKLYKKAILENFALNGKPDNVHVHVAMKAGMLALWIKRKWNIPFVVSEHWTGYHKQSSPSVYENNWYLKKMNKKVLGEAAMFAPVTIDLGETVKNNFINLPYRVIPNVVNTDLFYYKPFTVPKFRFVHFSYMHYQKNPEGILAAANRVREIGYDFDLLMIGNDEKQLTDMARNYSLLKEIVSFKAAVSYEEVAIQMQQASALLLFSRFENLPCVILEALCCGLPVISTDVGGISEVVNKENGILVENEKVSQLANAMVQLLDNYTLYDKESIAGNAHALFNYRTVGGQYFNCYNNAGKS